jgi:hypothetical protein
MPCSRAVAPPKQILVVDHSDDTREVVADMLLALASDTAARREEDPA